MKTRLLTTLAALLLALTSWAKGVEIDGIYYDLDSSTKTASVTYTGSTWQDTTAYTGSITIPASVTYDGTTYTVASIGINAFRGCTGLASISIPASVTTIGDWAFSDCTGLTSLTIPASVTNIGRGAFSDCSGLASIKVEAGNTAYDSRENCNAIIETASNTLIAGCMNTTIPNSVTSIGASAFRGCTGLKSLNLPASVTAIGDWAFYGCTGLTNIYAEHTDPEAYHSSDYAFSDVPFSTCTLHVPIGSKEAYANTEPWSKFKNIVEAAAQTARHPVQSRRHGPQGARKVGHDAQKTHS